MNHIYHIIQPLFWMRLATFATRLCLAIICGFFMLVSSTQADDKGTEEKSAKIKSAFLYNFIKFIEWPAAHSPSITNKAKICLMGGNKFGSALDNLKASLSGKMELSIVTDVSAGEIGECNVLYITHADGGELSPVLESARRNNVLTVSEMNDFVEKGGVIEMKTVEKTIGLFSSNKINLRINMKAADAADLRINAQLLEIAAEVIK